MSAFFLNPVSEIAEVSVGQHFYWQIGPYEVHGQVLLMSWFVLGLIFYFIVCSKQQLKINTRWITKFY